MVTAIDTTPRHAVKTRLPDFVDNASPAPLATFLGVFSLGLGLAELLTPKEMAERTGVRYPGLLRAYGAREIASGLGILSTDRPAAWLWSRVAGDVLDLATIGVAYSRATRADDRRNALIAAAAVAGVTALDLACAQEHTRNPNPA